MQVRSLGYNHTDELMPFQIFLDNHTIVEPCVNTLFRVLVDQLIKRVAEVHFKKHTIGSLLFLALSFIKNKFGTSTQIEIDSSTS